ncbi:hypothetical protein BO94DRAFT_536947 [Aspergillus sclerotioniger CBS 115572]|uniref:Amino acid transporter transmembrane domain-containing protein n=1 Tax=Aspergillus sclerotioniger CBS 115572 TaxID=1450535 RepID=A0A317W535_9EURO|nr:hypothetical protein BO94DRAFT_536947 [Aspergillus sclerotioniger CBS 115572]PWY81746.1 hypothetical protein BO94DRAFT_536947 [Aspergillus sclerotioniger CBS 115572]
MAGVISAANLGGVADPRLGDEADIIGTEDEHHVTIERPSGHALHTIPAPVMHGKDSIYLDSKITFENYLFWAERSRNVEKHIRTDDKGLQQLGNVLIGRKIKPEPPQPVLETEKTSEKDVSEKQPAPQDEQTSEKAGSEKQSPPAYEATEGKVDKYGISETEWEQAQRAARTATWGSIFYLITTDILGPTNVPWAISQMGYGPGFALYTVFGIMAYYSGMQLWKMFVGLDSTRYPMRNYGDLAFRVYGTWARILVNVLQSFQFFLNVSLLIESSGQSLAQMAQGASGNGYLCFVVAEVIFTLIGFVLGQIRTLQRLSWLSNLAIWLNVIVIIMTMAVVYEYPPNYAAAWTSYQTPKGPVKTSANWPESASLYDRMTAVMNCVFAYGGATLFNELMAEMRRPFDFWKGFICAEVFIYVCYLVEGMVVYNAQGQFTYNPAYQGIPDSAYSYQTLGNALSFITSVIAALLYGNIGIKVFYSSVLRDVFHMPPLDHRTGKFIWIALVPIYWALAWIIAGAIPQISNLTSFVGALCILQFSYTFPPMLLVGYNVQKDAMLPGEEFNPITGETKRVDSGIKRWIRGYKKKFAMNTFDVLYSLAALGTAGMGLWASIVSMKQSFAETPLTPFTCTNPAG